MPPGITPPFVLRYSATSVPIVQTAISSDTLSEQQNQHSFREPSRITSDIRLLSKYGLAMILNKQNT